VASSSELVLAAVELECDEHRFVVKYSHEGRQRLVGAQDLGDCNCSRVTEAVRVPNAGKRGRERSVTWSCVLSTTVLGQSQLWLVTLQWSVPMKQHQTYLRLVKVVFFSSPTAMISARQSSKLSLPYLPGVMMLMWGNGSRKTQWSAMVVVPQVRRGLHACMFVVTSRMQIDT